MTEMLGCDQRADGPDAFVLDRDFWLSKQALIPTRLAPSLRFIECGT
jgi:hypothetical protein